MTPPYWQGDSRWRDIVLGSGPARCGAAGCVACALTAAAVRIAGRDLNPGSAILDLINAPGAFVGDELVVPVAAPVLGLDAGPLVVDPDEIVAMIKRATGDGGAALVRVEVTGPGLAQAEGHTILGVTDAGPFIECLDSACPSQQGVQEGWSAIAWATLQNASPMLWNKVPRTYTVRAARELRKAQVV